MSNPRTFKEAYATLQKHAQTLRSQQDPDIDNLTTLVAESVEAYRICKERIDAVAKALEQSLGPDPLAGQTNPAAQKSVVPAVGALGGEDDAPF